MPTLTPTILARRSLSHFRFLTLALILAVAVTTAVITGALLVGDSVRASLRDMALKRLGPVTHALVSPQPFNQSLVDALKKSNALPAGADAAPLLSVRGSGKVINKYVAGIDILATSGALDPTASDTSESRAVINGELVDAVDASDDFAAPLSLRVPTLDDSAASRDAVMADRSRSAVVSGELLRRATRIARAPAFDSLFSLTPSQRPPKLAWVPLDVLQEAVDAPKKINAILFTNVPSQTDLAAPLKSVMTLEDYGLYLAESEDHSYVTLLSRSVYLPPAVIEAAHRAAGPDFSDLSVNLVHTLTNPRTGKSTLYATGAGISSLLEDKSTLAKDEVAINEWTENQLGAKPGDSLIVTVYHRDRDGNLKKTDSAALNIPLKIGLILPMSGLGADRSLVPEFKGMTDAKSVHDWRKPPGLDIDASLADDPYWEKFRASPKIFFNFGTSQKLFDSSTQTGVRIPAKNAAAFRAALLKELKPADIGLTIVPLRDLQLAAAAGSSDFSQLFIGFSFFLVISAVIILAALFRLSIEQRARQLGLLAALGFSPRAIRNLFLRESLLIALVGALLGLLLAIGYTALMIYGLRTWWVGATGTSYLSLHVSASTLLTGLLITLLLSTLTVLLSLRKVLKTPPARLLAGDLTPPRPHLRSRKRLIYFMIGTIVAGGGNINFLFLHSEWTLESSSKQFLVAGISLLIAGLCYLRALIEPSRTAAPLRSTTALALRSAGFRPTRALLTAALIALASFSLVTVASMKQTPPVDTRHAPSGTGGFPLILHADIPLPADINTKLGQDLLGLTLDKTKDAGSLALLSRASFTNLRAGKAKTPPAST